MPVLVERSLSIGSSLRLVHDLRLQRILGLQADKLVDRLAVLEQDQRRNAHDAELRCQLRLLVDVDLADRRLTCKLAGELLYDWKLHLARAAPRRPEIHERYAVLYAGSEVFFR